MEDRALLRTAHVCVHLDTGAPPANGAAHRVSTATAAASRAPSVSTAPGHVTMSRATASACPASPAPCATKCVRRADMGECVLRSASAPTTAPAIPSTARASAFLAGSETTALRRVPLDTGVLIVSTRVTVTTVPSAVPTMGSAGAARAGPDSTAHSGVLQGSMAGTVLRFVTARMVQTVIISAASAPAEQASLGRAVSRSVLPVHLGMAASSCVSA